MNCSQPDQPAVHSLPAAGFPSHASTLLASKRHFEMTCSSRQTSRPLGRVTVRVSGSACRWVFEDLVDPCGPWLGPPVLEAALPGVVKRPPDSWSGETQNQQTPWRENDKSLVAGHTVPKCDPCCVALGAHITSNPEYSTTHPDDQLWPLDRCLDAAAQKGRAVAPSKLTQPISAPTSHSSHLAADVDFACRATGMIRIREMESPNSFLQAPSAQPLPSCR